MPRVELMRNALFLKYLGYRFYHARTAHMEFDADVGGIKALVEID